MISLTARLVKEVWNLYLDLRKAHVFYNVITDYRVPHTGQVIEFTRN